MIVTVTPNPSIDRTLHLARLERGGVVRAGSSTAEAGGKGLNVARALTTHGLDAMAVLPLSDASAGAFLELVGESASVATAPIAGEVRVNISLVEQDGTVTKVNEPGPTVSAAEGDALLARVTSLAAGAAWVVGSGSLPPGLGSDFYARLAEALPPGGRLAVDAEGEALRSALTASPMLIKPNRHELEGLCGRGLDSLGDVVQAAQELVETRRVGAVLVSLGSDGALYVEAGRAIHAEARIEAVANTVGAGDALLAGFVAGAPGTETLRTAVAWSVAACRSPGTQMRPLTPDDLAVVVVHDSVDMRRRLAA